MHVPPQYNLKRLKHNVTWILTPPYYERQAHSVSHTNKKVSISQHLHLLRAVTFVSLHVPPQPVSGLASQA
jgi:hypothetical protein